MMLRAVNEVNSTARMINSPVQATDNGTRCALPATLAEATHPSSAGSANRANVSMPIRAGQI